MTYNIFNTSLDLPLGTVEATSAREALEIAARTFTPRMTNPVIEERADGSPFLRNYHSVYVARIKMQTAIWEDREGTWAEVDGETIGPFDGEGEAEAALALIGQARSLGLDVEAARCDLDYLRSELVEAIVSMPAEQRAAAVERANRGEPVRLSEEWSA